MSKTTPHLNRGLQRQMLTFVALCGVLLTAFLWSQANRPRTERRLISGQPSISASEPNDWNALDGSDLRDDEFRAPPDLKRHDTASIDQPDDWKEPPPIDPASSEDAMERDAARLETRFDKRILSKVQDNTIGIRRDEADAYYRLLDHARRVSAVELEKAGMTDVQYINLMEQPNRFRGEPVTIHGDLFRLRRFAAGPNPMGVKSVYEAWIFTSDSNNRPYRVLCTSVPNDFELASDVRKSVKVTGYFFKREGFESNGGIHVAPTLLAHRIESFRRPGAPPTRDGMVPYLMELVTAVTLAFLVTLVSLSIGDRRAAMALRERKKNSQTHPSFAGIVGARTTAEEETLRLFAEMEVEDARHDISGKDPAELLQARDQATVDQTANQTEEVPADPTEQELAARLHSEAEAIYAWTEQQRAIDQSATPSPETADQEQERLAADQVLETLQSNPLVALAQQQASDQEIEQAAAEPIVDVVADAASVCVSQTSQPSPTSPTSPTLAASATVQCADQAPTDETPVEPTEQPRRRGNDHSRLSAWEEEIQQFAAAAKEIEAESTAQALAVQIEVEQDERARDRELHDRVRTARIELEHERQLDEPATEGTSPQADQPVQTDLGTPADDQQERHETELHPHLQIDRAERIDHHAPRGMANVTDENQPNPSTDAGAESMDDSEPSEWTYERGNKSNRRRFRHGGR